MPMAAFSVALVFSLCSKAPSSGDFLFFEPVSLVTGGDGVTGVAFSGGISSPG
jgi:hypothetical protein